MTIKYFEVDGCVYKLSDIKEITPLIKESEIIDFDPNRLNELIETKIDNNVMCDVSRHSIDMSIDYNIKIECERISKYNRQQNKTFEYRFEIIFIDGKRKTIRKEVHNSAFIVFERNYNFIKKNIGINPKEILSL